MNEYTSEELYLIERALICMNGIFAVMDKPKEYERVLALIAKVNSIRRAAEEI